MCDSGVSLSSGAGEASDCDTGGHTVTIQVNSPRPGDFPGRLRDKGHGQASARSPLAMSSPQLSRSGSTSSLASSLSCAPVQEVRNLTNNFQRLLNQATREIKKLTAEKTQLEVEQEKLLTVNVELAIETKQLLERQKEWQEQEAALCRANEEFVAEVERLYREEERWEQETEELRKQGEQNSQRLSQEVSSAREEVDSCRLLHEADTERLVSSVQVLTRDCNRLLQEKEQEKQHSSRSHTDLKQEHEQEVTRLRASLENMQGELEVELTAREEAEAEAERLAGEVERLEEAVGEARREARDQVRQARSSLETKVSQLETRSEKLAAENFELAMEQEELKGKVKVSQEAARKAEREAGQSRVEKEWLITQQKAAGASSEKVQDVQVELDQSRTELREEKTKVKNLADWKSQLAEKNKELKDENIRLVRKVENLEHLMNEEATDINEMLSVISNIQTGKEGVDIKALKKRYM